MDQCVLLDILRPIDYPNITQPVDCVVCVQSTLRTDEFLLNIRALNREWQFGCGHVLAIYIDLHCPECVIRFPRRYVHHTAYAVLARKKTARKYRQQENVNNISAQSVPYVALAKHRYPPVLLCNPRPSQSELAPG